MDLYEIYDTKINCCECCDQSGHATARCWAKQTKDKLMRKGRKQGTSTKTQPHKGL